MKKIMRKVMKRSIAFFLAFALIIPSNVGSIFAADSQTPRDDIWTVSDVGDQVLYNYLLALYPSSDGLLYKSDTAKLTYFYTNSLSSNNVSAYNYLPKVQSFDSLYKICPNIKDFDIYNLLNDTAYNSIINVMTQYVKDGNSTITNLDLYNHAITDDNVTQLESLNNLTNLTLDVSKISALKINELLSKIGTKITDLSLTGLDETKDIDLSYLKSMVVNSSFTSFSLSLSLSGKLSDFTYQSIEKLSLLNSLQLQNIVGKIPMDFSKLTSLHSLTISGTNLAALPDLSNVKATSVTLNNYSAGNVQTYLTGLKLNSSVAYNSIYLSGIDLSANLGWEAAYNFKSVHDIHLSNCKLSDNTIDITNIGSDQNYGLSNLSIYKCGLTSIKGLDIVHKYCYNVDLSNNALTEIPDLSDWNNLRTLTLSNNKLTKIGSLPSQINSISLNGNSISDANNLSNLAATTGEGTTIASKYVNLNSLDLRNNQLSTLPDLSKISSLEKPNYTNSYLSNLLVYGNNFTSPEESIKGKVSDAFYKDPQWLNKTMAKVTSNGNLYYENLNDSIISYSFTGTDTVSSLFTSNNNISISKEVMSWLKLKGFTLYIYIIDPTTGLNLSSININGKNLDSDEGFSYSNSVTTNPYLDQINAVFKTGSVLGSFKEEPVSNNNRAGISVSSFGNNSIANNLMKAGKNYNIYKFNPNNNAYAYYITVNKNSYISYTGTYFIVDADTDQNIGIFTSTNSSGYTSVSGYYKNLDDATISNIIDNYSTFNISSINTLSKDITISEENINKITNSNIYLSFRYLNSNDIYQYVSINHLNNLKGQVKISFPTITDSTTTNLADLTKAYTFGTPSNYITYSPSTGTSGLSYYTYYNDASSSSVYYNLYLYDDNLKDFALVLSHQTKNSVYNLISIPGTYFIVPETNDSYLNAGSNINYKNLNDDVINRQLKLSAKYSNVSLNFNIDSNSQITLSQSVLNNLKTSGSKISITYISNLNTTSSQNLGKLVVDGTKFGTITGDLVLKCPFELSTNNDKLAAAFASYGTPIGYVTVNGNKIDGVTAFVSYSSLKAAGIKVNGMFHFEKYNSDSNNFVDKTLSSIDGYVVELGASYVIVNASDYVTPGDADKEPTTPTEPTAPTQPTVPSDSTTTTQPTTTEPTQPTAPVEPAAPTQPTAPAEPIVNNTPGEVSAPVTYEKDIVGSEAAVSTAVDKMKTTALPEVEVVSNSAPTVDPNLFRSMKDNHKDVTLGVTNEKNQLQYSWTFSYDTLKNTDMAIDLSVKFDTDKKAEIEKITGKNDAMYLSFAHHGELPGPALMKTYVGEQYKNGDVLYLYYFNEASGKIEAIGGGGLTVEYGYVQYTITHCSVYFLSQETPQAIGASLEGSNSTIENPTPTGDMAHPFALLFILGSSMLVFAFANKKRRAVR